MNDKIRAQNFWLEAKKMLGQQDFVEFMTNISKAEIFAENDPEELAKITYLRVEGLFAFNQYKKVLENLPVALKYNTDKQLLRLQSYKGVSLGYLGRLVEATSTLTQLVDQATDHVDIFVRACLSIAWIYLTLNKDNINEENLEHAKTYLDKANVHFEAIPNFHKWRICNNYSIYHYHKNDHDRAIEFLKKSIEFCEERDLPYVYENLAEIYLQFDGIDMYEEIKTYTQQAEVIANKYQDKIAIGRAFYIQAMSELKDNRFFEALDTLYIAFDYFNKAEAYPFAFDCLVKINELLSEYKVDRLKALKDSLKNKFKDTPFYEKI